jgi:hypothetical protein
MVLRLALLAIIFLFLLAAAFAMRAGLRRPQTVAPGSQRDRGGGPRLVVISPANTGLPVGVEFALAGEMSLGRDSSNGIVLGDASVSGRHALIQARRQGWRLADLGSTNGTVVNGRPLDGRAALLRGGEQVAFGAVVLRFRR